MKVTLAAVAALMIVPGIAMAQQDTTRMQQDTSMRSDTGQGVMTDTSRGEVAGRNKGLSTQQVTQWQTALDSAGCSVTADGNFGPATDQAISCFQKQENLSGQNLNDVLRRLNLGFTASDSLLPPSKSDTSGMYKDTSSMKSDTSMYMDTSSMKSDTSMRMDTSSMQMDTSSMQTDTSTVSRGTSRTGPRG
jgi:peptidoglycan hydrolase-like protein with peptidoglycan-binding domain